MERVTTIGLDIAKHVFHAHGADEHGRAVFSRKLSRGKLISIFAAQPRCLVALEACAGSHHWGRELMRLGHEVRLIPPAYVKFATEIQSAVRPQRLRPTKCPRLSFAAAVRMSTAD